MIRCWHIFALGLIALCCCASSPALSQGRSPERRPGREPLGAYIIQSEEEARQQLEAEEETRPREGAAQLPDRLSRVEGRLEGMEAANEQATRHAEGVLTTVRWCTIVVSGLIVLVVGGLGAVLGFFGYRELKGIRAARERVEAALKQTTHKADDAVKKAETCAAAAAESLQAVEQLKGSVEKSLESAEKMRGEIAERREKATVDAEVLADLRKQAEAAAEREPTKEVSAQERRAEEHAARGEELFDRDEYEDALVEYDRALSATPNDAFLHLFRANALSGLGRYEEALAACDRAIELRSDLAISHRIRGIVLTWLGRYDECVAAFDRAIQLDADYASAYYERACAHARLNNRDEARRDLAKAIELDEKHREMARTDDDFDNLREDVDFRKLVGLEEEESA